MDPSQYRPCVGIMLLNKDGLVFIGRRKQKRSEQILPGHEWQMPQGGIDAGETAVAAARRELREETNIAATRLLGEAPDWYFYDLPEPAAKQTFGGRYKGQRLRWVALGFDGDESEIDIGSPAEDGHPEFEAWRWESMDRLPGLIVPFKRQVYEQAVAAFRHLARRGGQQA